MDKKKYDGLKLDVVTIEAEDVIVTSIPFIPCDNYCHGDGTYCPGDGTYCKKNTGFGCCTMGERAY